MLELYECVRSTASQRVRMVLTERGSPTTASC